jgi:hypothetical protein
MIQFKADCGNFRKCILLWLYALDTQQKCLEPLHPMIQSSFLSFTELFQYMQKQLAPYAATLTSSMGSAQNVRDAPIDDSPSSFSYSPNSSSLSPLNTNSPSSNNNKSTGATNNDSNVNNAMFEMLNMYTATVLKILQKAVEEIKRGIVVIDKHKQQKKEKKQNNEDNFDGLSLEKLTTKDENDNQSDEDQSKITKSTATTSGSASFDIAHFDRTLVVIVHFLIVVAESLRHCSPEDTFKVNFSFLLLFNF